MINDKNKHSWCANPYINLSVHPSGSVKTCCMSELNLITDNGHTSLNQASILDFWNSKKRQQMIEDMNNGIQIPECSFCWQEDLAGKESKRFRDNITYADKNLSKNDLPIVMDLSMGNLCNIKCRICSPVHSTPWVQEEAKIWFPHNPREYTDQLHWVTTKESFDYNNEYLWTDILSLLPNVTKFDFAGGEPFYIEKHWDIVKTCVSNGWSKNQHIHYNTNGTIYPEKYIDLLDQFKIVDIQVSTDGTGKQFEYLRHGASWITSEEVIDKLCAIRDSSNTEWIIGVCISISAFNIYEFFNIFEHYAKKGVNIYVNVVHDHHSASFLPKALKEIIIQKINNTESEYKSHQWEKEKLMMINHLNNTNYNESQWKEFWREIKIRDSIRKESYEETFPEFYQIMKQYIIKDEYVGRSN